MSELRPATSLDRTLDVTAEFAALGARLESISSYSEGLGLYRDPVTGAHILCRDPKAIDLGGKATGYLGLLRRKVSTVREVVLISSDLFADLVNSAGTGLIAREAALPKILDRLPSIIDAAKEVGAGPLVAFRSSGQEDSAAHTAAGLFETEFANLRSPAEILAAKIYNVCESAYSENAQAFYRKHDLHPKPMALMVWKLIDENDGRSGNGQEHAPALSGVIDTAHPDEIRVTVVRGLATAVVGGRNGVDLRIPRALAAGDPRPVVRISGEQFSADMLCEVDGSLEFETCPLPSWLLRPRHLPEQRRGDDRDLKTLGHTLYREITQIEGGAGVEGRAREYEFCIQHRAGPHSQWIRWLQERPIRALDPNFSLPTPGEPPIIRSAGGAVLGQGVVRLKSVAYFHVEPALNGERAGAEYSERIRQLALFNKAVGREGFALVVTFPFSGVVRDRIQEFHRQVPYHMYSNARAVIGIDTSGNNDHDVSLLAAHYAKFFQSEGMLFIAVPDVGMMRRRVEMLAERYSMQPREAKPVSLLEGHTGPTTIEGINELISGAVPGRRLARELVIAVDEYSGVGWVSYA